MSFIRIDKNPSRKQLAVFGVAWLIFLAGAGAVVARKGGPPFVRDLLWTLAVAVPVAGWIAPRFMRLVYLGMIYLTLPIGLVVSYVLVAVIYYLVLSPIGLLMRLFRYDPMHRKFDRQATTYWIARQPTQETERYFRQF